MLCTVCTLPTHTSTHPVLLLSSMHPCRLFLREYEALVHCEGHPCIVKVLGHCLGDLQVLPTLVLEYAGPVTL
jgi:hypothetical protein